MKHFYKWLAVVIALFATTISTIAQPTISSFTPTSGAVGTTITITGTNFNTTAANNIVFFGATKATVTVASATSLTVTVPTGATFGPITELNTATVLATYSTQFFNPTFTPSKGSITSADINANANVQAGKNPYSVAIGDIDGDGKPDLAVTNSGSNTVSILRNISTNGRIIFDNKVDFVTGSFSRSVAIGDIDGDGKPDLAIAVTGSSTVSILRNISTSGTISFDPKVDFPTGSNPRSVAIGDIDGDGKPDLVTANAHDNTVSVLRNISNSGTVNFAAKVDFAAGSGPFSVAFGDIDGDGKPDLAVANNGANTVSVLRNISTSGTVNFAAKVDFAAGSIPYSVAFGDIDGDGKPDLAVANYGGNTVSVLRNISTSGTISFAPKVDFGTGVRPVSVAIGDIDGDGKPDLAVANFSSSTLSVLRNTSSSGAVSFASKVDFAVGSPYTYAESVAIGDIDGDGKPDLVAATQAQYSNTVSILRNTPVFNSDATLSSLTTTAGIIIPTFATATIAYTASVANATSSVTVTPTVADATAMVQVRVNGGTYATVASGSASSALSLIVGSNTIDVTVTAQDGATIKTYTITVTRAAGSYIPTISSFTPISGAAGTTVTITGTNFNISAANNIVFFGATKATVTAASATSLTVIVPTGATFAPITELNTATVLATYSTQFFNPTFTPTKGSITTADIAAKVDVSTGSIPYSVAIGDIDGDGKPDIAIANASSNTVSILRNTGSSGVVSFATKVDVATGPNPYSIAIGDIDGDGKPDLAVVNYNNNTVSVLRNTSSSGVISFAAKVDLVTGLLPVSVAIGNIDGDGKPDLAIANYNDNTVSVLRNTCSIGTVSFDTKVDIGTGAHPFSVAIGDIDGDGKPDLAVANNGANTVSVLLNTSSIGTVSFITKVDVATGSSPFSVAIGDIDGDGKPDLATANFYGKTVSILRNTGSSGAVSFAMKVDVATGTLPISVAIGDIDGDGKPDLAVANNDDKTVSILHNTGSSGTVSFASKVDVTTGTGPRSVAIGDLDGDGKPDLAVANSNSNTVSILRNTPVFNANLSSLTTTAGTITPTFEVATRAYITSVPNATTSVTITPTVADAIAMVQVRVNGGTYATVASGSASSALSLNVGSNTIDVTVTAQDGATIKTYTITVTRADCIVNIPDANFKTYLVGNPSINTNGDTEIQCSEAAAFTGGMATNQLGITDLTGIEAFTSLSELLCQNNNLTSIDISHNTALTILSCGYNSITSLDVSHNTAITRFQCDGNKLISIDVSHNTSLTVFTCSNNNLTNLDVSHNTGLTNLTFDFNNLTNLDVSHNIALTQLGCGKNSLTSLDLSHNTALTSVVCSSNSLISLNIKNGYNNILQYFSADQNPNLSCIQVDNVANANGYSNWRKDASATYSTNCTCTPTTSTTTKSINPSALPYVWNGLTFTASGSQTAHLTNAAGCDSTATLNLTVNGKPSAGPDQMVLCGSSTKMVTLTGTLPTTGVWSSMSSNDATAVLSTSVNGVIYITLPVAPFTGKLSYIYTTFDGKDTVDIYVNGPTSPTINVNAGTPVLCNGTTVQLCPKDWGYSNYQWYKDGYAIVGATGVSSCITLDASGIGSYTLTGTNGSACWSVPSAPVVVSTVNSLSKPTITVTGATALCNGGSTILTSSATYGNQWFKNGNSTGVTSQSLTVTAPADYSVLVNSGNCASAMSLTTTIGSSVAPSSISGATTVVAGSTTQLTSATAGGVWTSDNLAVATIDGNGLVTAKAVGNATITYTITNSCGSSSVTQPITVTTACVAPVANFTITNATQCLGSGFTFTNTSTGTTPTYKWYFGDGGLAVTQDATHTYTAANTYNVLLTVDNACGSSSITKTVTVNAVPPTPSSISGATTVVAGSTTQLSSATLGGVWTSDNLAVATVDGNGLVTANAVGNATITYTITNSCGSSSVTQPITVTTACIAPVANFTITNATQCLASGFTFTNISTGTTPTYKWYFGDGGLAVTQDATHTYTAANTYNVLLTVDNACGSSSITKTVTVNAVPPTPSSISGATTVVAGSTTQLTSATAGGVWTSDNLAVATIDGNGLVTAKAVGNAIITYTITNSCGSSSVTQPITVTTACIAPVANFIITNATQCLGSGFTFTNTSTGTTPTYKWYFGDGGLAVTQDATHTYTAGNTYNVLLTVDNACGSSSITKQVIVNAMPPTPSSISGATTVVAGSTTQLSSGTSGGVWTSDNLAVATVDVNTGLVTGVTAGSVTITYTVTNGCGSSSVTQPIAVTSASIVVPPTPPCNLSASFSINNTTQCVTGNSFIFTSNLTGGTAPFTYMWDLNDGTTANSASLTKTYTNYGEHDVTLKVNDANGCISNPAGQHVSIVAKPKASFSILSNTGNGKQTTFISSSTIASGTMTYLWDLGNGQTSTLSNPTTTYTPAPASPYTITLTVSGLGSCNDVATQTYTQYVVASVSVYPNPVLGTIQVSVRAASVTPTTFKIMDLAGRVLRTQTVIPIAAGSNVLATLDTRGLQSGSYVIYISDEANGFLATKAILKQ